MRMLMIGTGPIGGIIGGRLARAGHDIYFVDVDREHVAAIRANGLHVDVPDGAFRVNVRIGFPGELQGSFDTVFLAVRSNYTADALATALPHLAAGGLLVSLQNGINPPLLAAEVGPDRAVGVAIRMGCRKVAPGRVQTAIRGHLYLGHLHGRTTPRLESLVALLNPVIPSETTDNILGVLWSKLTYTCLGYFGSLADASLKTICEEDSNRRALVDFLGEVVAVGAAGGVRFVPLAEYDPADFHPARALPARLAALDDMAKGFKSYDRKGPLRQIQQGMVTEVDFTLAHVVREGERLGVPTPLCRKVLAMIHELEAGRRPLTLASYGELSTASG
ncbi:MAG TPA: 2-dehydropantoate 2-reductase N-terminal domain-containing protein [candidate division Zixibacteria bacterium]|nr:2-dehydropantoate 2-reductase N-terminal domain-containing protein [candidate division Zixibacteria bacterium]